MRNGGNGYERALLIFLAAGLLLSFAAVLFFPTPSFSERENRTLAPAPRFSFREIVEGTFADDTDLYLSERYPFRGTLRSIRSIAELALGKREVGGVILCTDGSLTKQQDVDPQILETNLRGIARLFEKAEAAHLSSALGIAPRRQDARREVLPLLFQNAEPEWDSQASETYTELFSNAADFGAICADEDWYRTDHHWTTLGAYRAYLALCPTLGITPYPREDFTEELVREDFLGTADAAAGIPLVSPDTLTLYRFENDEDFTVIKDEKNVSRGFYEHARLESRDKYGVFFGGNYGTLRIFEENRQKETLLVIKDSFANAVIPFLARHFDILAVDPRYTNRSLSSFLPDADGVLVLMGLQSLGESRLFKKI